MSVKPIILTNSHLLDCVSVELQPAGTASRRPRSQDVCKDETKIQDIKNICYLLIIYMSETILKLLAANFLLSDQMANV